MNKSECIKISSKQQFDDIYVKPSYLYNDKLFLIDAHFLTNVL